MNTLTSRLSAFAAALAMNSLILCAIGYVFALQTQPHLSAVSLARQLASHQWLI